jgi:hypothetical protein
MIKVSEYDWDWQGRDKELLLMIKMTAKTQILDMSQGQIGFCKILYS